MTTEFKPSTLLFSRAEEEEEEEEEAPD